MTQAAKEYIALILSSLHHNLIEMGLNKAFATNANDISDSPTVLFYMKELGGLVYGGVERFGLWWC